MGSNLALGAALVVTTVAGVVLAPRCACADDVAVTSPPPACANETQGLVWLPDAVRFPVAREDVSGDAPFVPPGVREVRGAVRVGPGRGAAFWLEPLEVARVVVEGAAGAAVPRFARIEGAVGQSRVVLDEPGVPAGDGVWYLAQPPGEGGAWVVDSATAPTLRVERLSAREGRLVWESVRRELLAWVDHGGCRPALPARDGAGLLGARLDAEAEIAVALREEFRGDAALERAISFWRKASALEGITRLRPLLAQHFRVASLEGALTGMGDEVTWESPEDSVVPAAFRRVAGLDNDWTLSLRGPGVLRVDARALFAAEGAESRAARLELRVDGVTVDVARLDARPVLASREPGRAFPEPTPRRTRAGEFSGSRLAVSAAMPPGEHRYEILASGGPLAVRAVTGQRRAWVGEILAHQDDVADFVAAARDALRGSTSPGVDVLRALLARLDGTALPLRPPDAVRTLRPLSRLLTGVAHARAQAQPAADGALAREAAELLPAVDAAASPALAWWLRLEAAREVARATPQGVGALFAAAPAGAPPALLAAAARWVPDAVGREAEGSRALGALELAERGALGDPEVRGQFARVWREQTTWGALEPEEPGVAALQVLDRRAGAEPGPRALRRLEPGHPVRLEVPASALDLRRPAVVRVLVSRATGDAGAVQLRIDGERFAAPTDAGLEAWSFAVAPGTHEFEADGAATGTEVFVSLPRGVDSPGEASPAADTRAPDAVYLRRFWPARASRGGEPVRFALPSPAVPGPLRVELRARGAGRLAVRVRTDAGPSRSVVLEARGQDRALAPGAAAREVSRAGVFALELPSQVRAVWFEPEGEADVFVAVSVRRAAVEAPARTVDRTEALAARPEGQDALAWITSLSARLATEPGDVAARLARARELLDLGQMRLARFDLARAVRAERAADRSLPSAATELAQDLQDARDPTHLPTDGLAGAASTPTPLWPARLALASDAERAEVQRAESDAGAGRLLESGRALANLYARTGRWQVALAALAALEQAMLGGEPEVVATRSGEATTLAYALAVRLDARGRDPLVRRVLGEASAASAWEPLRGAESSAGYERLLVDGAAEPPGPVEALRRALVPAPWPLEQGQLIAPGRRATVELTLDSPARLEVEVYYQALDPAARAPVLRVTADGESDARPVPEGRAATLLARELPAGRHRVEVQAPEGGEEYLVAVRFRTDRTIAGSRPELPRGVGVGSGGAGPGAGEGFALRADRSETAYACEPGRPVVLTVQAPAVLRVQARARADRAARAVRIEGAGEATVLALPSEMDPAVRGEPGRPLGANRAAEVTLWIDGSGPRRVTLQPGEGGGVALVRAWTREPRGRAQRTESAERPGTSGADAAASSTAPEPIAWPALFAPRAVVLAGAAPPPAWAVGSFAAGLALRASDDPESDAADVHVYGQATLEFRRQILRDAWWVRAGSGMRVYGSGELVAEARLQTFAQRLPLGLRAYGSLLGHAQPTAGAWSASGLAGLDRVFHLGNDVIVVPQLFFGARYQSLSPADAALRNVALDPDVYSLYAAQHPRALTPNVIVGWWFAQDQIVYATADLVTNADLYSPDRVETGVGWSTLLIAGADRALTLNASYRAGYRFADADRAQAFVRHDVGAGLELSLWTGEQGRFVLGAREAVYVSDLYGAENVASVWLRYELTRGRRLDDLMPNELIYAFDDVLRRRQWAELPGEVP